MSDGKKESERIYHFMGNAALANRYDTFKGGEKNGYTEIQRNSSGEATRYDRYTVDGTRTGYSVCSYNANTVECTLFNADGTKSEVQIQNYGPNGPLTNDICYFNPERRSFRMEYDFDQNGQTIARRQFRDGKLEITSKFTYNAKGDRLRDDAYTGTGKWFSKDEYAEGLRTRRLYKGGEELRYTYDQKHLLKETLLYLKHKLVCRLEYDRLSDGTTKRTLAIGPDGALWAEYPDQEVRDVDIRGQTFDGNRAVIHKTGNWW